MEKKTYLTPRTELIYMNANSYLLNWSADKVPGGGGNVPEAKAVILSEDLEDDEEDTTALPYYNIWED